MKKTFFQTNILFQIFSFLFFVAFLGFQLFAMRIMVLTIEKVISTGTDMLCARVSIFLLFQIVAVLILRFFIRMEHNNIHIDNGKIYMTDDWLPKKEKIQYATSVYFLEIKAIDVIWSTKDSLLKTTPTRTFGGAMPKAYLSFFLNDGTQKNMLILYMSTKTIRSLVEVIKECLLSENNPAKIEDTDILVKKFSSKITIGRNHKW